MKEDLDKIETEEELQALEYKINEGIATREDVDRLTAYFTEIIRKLEHEDSDDRRQPRNSGVQKP